MWFYLFTQLIYLFAYSVKKISPYQIEHNTLLKLPTVTPFVIVAIATCGTHCTHKESITSLF